MTDAGTGALTDDLSSAITFVIYGMGSFCILTAYSTVLRNLHTAECSHTRKKVIEGHGDQTPHDATEPSTGLPSPGSPSHATGIGDEYTDLPPPHVPYWSLMPKHTTLQEHHHASVAPMYACVCQLPVAIPVAQDNVWTTASYPDAKTITCEPLLGPGIYKEGCRDLRRAATLYEHESTFGASRCRSVSCPAARSPPPSYTFSAPSGEKTPLSTIASPSTPAKASPPVVTLALTAQADTRDRRERSLYRAAFQVGLPLTSVALGDVYSIRVELNCPDNAQSHLLPSVLWCFTSTLAEIKKTRDSMRHEVHDDAGAATVLAMEIESSQDMQHFLDVVAKNRAWADAPSLRKFCQMW